MYSFKIPTSMFHSILRRNFSCSSNTMGKLSGKVAVVTASTKGIGYAIAKKLAQDGAHVVISSRNQTNVDEALESLKSKSLNVSGIACHVAKSDDRKKLVDLVKEKYGKLDILVSNAAVNPYFGPVLKTPESSYDKIFDVNVKATFMLIQEMHHLMESSRNPSITIVASIGGFVSFGNVGVYSVSKTTLIGMTKVLATEMAKQNIRVNCLCPGIVKTDFSQALTENETLATAFKKAIPLQRFAEPDDCSGIVAFLASDEATYITGENIVVSGGMHSRL